MASWERPDEKQVKKRDFFRQAKPLAVQRVSVAARSKTTDERSSIGSRASFSKRPRFSTALTGDNNGRRSTVGMNNRANNRTSIFSNRASLFSWRGSRRNTKRNRSISAGASGSNPSYNPTKNKESRRFSWFSIGSHRRSSIGRNNNGQIEEDEDAPVWEARQTLEGMTYYWNLETAEVSWTLPEDLMDDAQRADMAKQWIWVPHPKQMWQPAHIVKSDKETIAKTMEGKTVRIPAIKIMKGELTGGFTQRVNTKPMNRLTLDNIVDDLVDLEEVTEGAVLHNCRTRFLDGQIYSWIGTNKTVLVAINPYEDLGLYTEEQMKFYKKNADSVQTPAPHVFGIASACLDGLVKENRNQSILVSGESGSGKTQATKQCLDYITYVAGSMKPEEAPPAKAGGRKGRKRRGRDRNRNGGGVTGQVKMVNAGGNNSIEEKILQCNPLLEAFGNAKTVRNNNSSRFGKWIAVYIQPQRKRVTGARIENFLLETTRVIKQAANERNYHVFYQILADDEMREQYSLEDAATYVYANQGNCIEIDGVDDLDELSATKLAMEKLTFEDDEQEWMFRTCAALLHLGNTEFEQIKIGNQKGSKLSSDAGIKQAAELLKIDFSKLEKVMTTRNVKTKGETVNTPRKLEKAISARDSLSKAIYGKLFDWLVERINESFGAAKGKLIGILDIFGFESFEFNSYEQLCINYTNETLQDLFNRNTFGNEQELYEIEGIKFDKIEFTDNKAILQLLAGKGDGILNLLDDECTAPGGTEERFLKRIEGEHGDKNKKYFKANVRNGTFKIKHYAEEVEYSVENFLVKNTDSLNLDLYEICAQSSDVMTKALFPPIKDGERHRIKSTGAKFRDQLRHLIGILEDTSSHFIRCIKPTDEQTPKNFDGRKIASQLNASAVVSSINVRKKGFSHRLMHEQFVQVYKTVNGPDFRYNSHPKSYEKLCKEIIQGCFKQRDLPGIQVGEVRVLFKKDEYRFLELNRTIAFLDLLPKFQAVIRGINARKFVEKLRKLIKDLDEAVEATDIDAIERIEREIPERLGRMGEQYGIEPKNFEKAKRLIKEQSQWTPIKEDLERYAPVLDTDETTLNGEEISEDDLEGIIASALLVGEQLSMPMDIKEGIEKIKNLKQRIHREELNKQYLNALNDNTEVTDNAIVIADVENADDYIVKEREQTISWIERTAENALNIVDKEMLRSVEVKAIEYDYTSPAVTQVTEMLQLPELEFVEKELESALIAQDKKRIINRTIRKQELHCAANFDKYKYFHMLPQLRNPPQEVYFVFCFCIPTGTGVQEESADLFDDTVSPTHRMANRRRKFLKWSYDEYIPKSLLRLDDEVEDIALQCYERAFQFIHSEPMAGDDHALRLVNMGIVGGKGLRNEIYTQIIKLLTDNPNLEATVKGVELLGLCLACLRPDGETFQYFLITWMRTHLKMSIYRHYMSALHDTKYTPPVKPFKSLNILRAKLDTTAAGSRFSLSRQQADPFVIPAHHKVDVIGTYDILDGFLDDFDTEEEINRRNMFQQGKDLAQAPAKLLHRQVKQIGTTLKRLGAKKRNSRELAVVDDPLDIEILPEIEN